MTLRRVLKILDERIARLQAARQVLLDASATKKPAAPRKLADAKTTTESAKG